MLCSKNICNDFSGVMIYSMPQPTRSFLAVNSAPHLIHLQTDFKGCYEVCIFWVYVCLEFLCFFKTDMTVFWLCLTHVKCHVCRCRLTPFLLSTVWFGVWLHYFYSGFGRFFHKSYICTLEPHLSAYPFLLHFHSYNVCISQILLSQLIISKITRTLHL